MLVQHGLQDKVGIDECFGTVHIDVYYIFLSRSCLSRVTMLRRMILKLNISTTTPITHLTRPTVFAASTIR